MLTEFPKLTIGKHQRAECSQSFESLVAMLLSSTFVDRCSWQLGLTSGNLASLVDEILQQVAFVLCQEKNLGLLDNIAKVSHEMTTFFRELG